MQSVLYSDAGGGAKLAGSEPQHAQRRGEWGKWSYQLFCYEVLDLVSEASSVIYNSTIQDYCNHCYILHYGTIYIYPDEGM